MSSAEYRAKHGEERNAARRARYAADVAYRDQQKARANAYAVRHRDEIRERNRVAYDAREYGHRIDAWRPSAPDSSESEGSPRPD